MTNIEAMTKSKMDSNDLFGHSKFVIPPALSFLIRHLMMAALDQFLKVIVEQGGSDLHIGEGQPPKMRKHGDIAPIREKSLVAAG